MSLNVQFLSDMLRTDTAAIIELKSLLEQERQLLETRQLQGLQAIIDRKDNLLGQLRFSAKQREQILGAAGLSTDLAGWEAFLLRDGSTRFLIPEWQKITQTFIECQKANEINGKMIGRSKQTLNHLLNLLRGQVAPPTLYNQKGAAAHYSNSYSMTKA